MHRSATASMAIITALLASAVAVSAPLMAAPPLSAASSSDAGSRSSQRCREKCAHFPWPPECVKVCRSATKRYKGEIASVDTTAKSFVVHPAKGADITLKVNDKTTYSPKGKGWDDVKAGAAVSGGYKNDGTDNWATSVKFAAEKAAAPARTGS
jgi:hypothetical protein